ncbi:MAG: 3'(2'),5'-bisphosphate nucleotidase CysQ [Pseudomonadota bacterium]
MQLTQALLNSVVDIAYQAGEKILLIYKNTNVDIINKNDGSPLTQADLLAHQTIVAGLKKLTPDIPVLSEESAAEEIQQRREWPVLWLVDPLDGTKEFIHRTDEFTVNIALIVNHQPVLGVVYAPALGVMYFAMDGVGAYKLFNGKKEKIFVSSVGGEEASSSVSGTHPPVGPLPFDRGLASSPFRGVRVVASRRHGGEELEKFLLQIPEYTLVNAGSALKICLVAEGAADLYPRLGPTCEWDTAAGHAIMNNAGGILCDSQYRSFKYNARDTLLNGSFVVSHREARRFVFC